MAGCKSPTGFVVVDVLAVSILGSLILIFHFAVTPFHRGFYCDDETIKYPYHDSTITSLFLYFFGTLSNIFIMTLVEGLIYYKSKMAPIASSATLFFSKKVHPFLWQMYKVLGVFSFTCCTSQMLTDIAKYTIGRHRPHFLDICRPNMTDINCSTYVTNYTCTGLDAYRIREASLSFPSGHASFSAVTMVYLVLYVQARLIWSRTHLIRPFLQVAAYSFAFYTALSRVSDYKHHPTDVIAGHILGTSVAVFMVYFFSGLFTMRGSHDKQQDKEKRERDIPI